MPVNIPAITSVQQGSDSEFGGGRSRPCCGRFQYRLLAAGGELRAAMELAQPPLKTTRDPCDLIAKRIERCRWEILVFVEDSAVLPKGHSVERARRRP